MGIKGNRFTAFQRSLIKQLVLEADVQRLTGPEMSEYVRNHLKDTVSDRYLHYVKNNLKSTAAQQLNLMRKHRTAFISEVFFKRVKEIEQYQRELWRIFNENRHSPFVQKHCIAELHQLTITLASMWDALPQLSGLTFFTAGGLYNGEKDLSSALRNASDRKEGDSSSGESSGDDSYKPVV